MADKSAQNQPEVVKQYVANSTIYWGIEVRTCTDAAGYESFVFIESEPEDCHFTAGTIDESIEGCVELFVSKLRNKAKYQQSGKKPISFEDVENRIFFNMHKLQTGWVSAMRGKKGEVTIAVGNLTMAGNQIAIKIRNTEERRPAADNLAQHLLSWGCTLEQIYNAKFISTSN